MKLDRVMLVGVGGTGSHLVEPLARLLHYHPQGTSNLILVDGDRYEEKNKDRQLFDDQFLGLNKATALAKRVEFMNVQVVDRYIDRRFLGSYLRRFEENENIVIIAAVDNHRSRHDILLSLKERKNAVYIAPGNQLASGHAMAWMKIDGKEIFVHPFDRYPDIREPTDNIPGRGTCQRQQVSEPQLIIANAMCSVLILNYVQNLLDNVPIYDELFFDSRRMAFGNSGQKHVFAEEVRAT